MSKMPQFVLVAMMASALCVLSVSAFSISSTVLYRNLGGKCNTLSVGGHARKHLTLASIKCNAPSSTGTKSHFKLSLAGDTALTVKQFTYPAAVELGNQINKLVGAFKNLKAAEVDGGKRPIQEPFEFEWKDGSSSLRMEANPNLFTNAFNAKVFVLFEDETMRMSSQVSLPDLVDTVKDFKMKNAA